MIELGRSTVQSWDIDVMGHMNIQLYYERTFDALAMLGAAIGLGPRRLAQEGLRFRILDQHSRLVRELRQGGIYSVRGSVAAMGGAALTLYAELVNAKDDTLSATMRTDCELASAEGPVPFAGEQLALAEPLREDIPAHGRPRGLTLGPPARIPTLAEADRLGFIRTYEGVVKPQECDRDGTLQPRYVTGHIINAIPHLQRRTAPDASGTERLGGAAVEARVLYLAMPRAGDILSVRSAITFVGERHYCWRHWLFDFESGAALARQDSVSVPMDLAERKALPLTEGFQRRLRERMVPGEEP